MLNIKCIYALFLLLVVDSLSANTSSEGAHPVIWTEEDTVRFNTLTKCLFLKNKEKKTKKKKLSPTIV